MTEFVCLFRFLVESFDFSLYRLTLFASRDNFTSSLPLGIPFISLSWITALIKTWETCNQSSEDHPHVCLLLDLAFNFPPFSTILTEGSSSKGFMSISSVHQSSSVFFLNQGILNCIKNFLHFLRWSFDFFAFFEMVFILHSIGVIFTYSFEYTWDRWTLIIVNILLVFCWWAFHLCSSRIFVYSFLLYLSFEGFCCSCLLTNDIVHFVLYW